MKLLLETYDGHKKSTRVTKQDGLKMAASLVDNYHNVRLVGEREQYWFDRDGTGVYQVRQSKTMEWSDDIPFEY